MNYVLVDILCGTECKNYLLFLFQREQEEENIYRYKVATGDYKETPSGSESKAKRYKRDGYFSDEEELADD